MDGAFCFGALDARRSDCGAGAASRLRRTVLGEPSTFTVDFGARERTAFDVALVVAKGGTWNALQVWTRVWFDATERANFRPAVLEGPGPSSAGDVVGSLLLYVGSETPLEPGTFVKARFGLDPVAGSLKLLDAAAAPGAPAPRSSYVSGASFPQWHFPMLEDGRRNAAYRNALKRVMKRRPGAVVLDVGAGAGLLSMIAARQGASAVVAVESDADMCAVLRATLAANRCAASVVVVNALSTDVDVDDAFRGGPKADVIVAEIFDAGLVGERCLASLKDAATRFLADGGELLPRFASLYCLLLDTTPTCDDFDLGPLDHVPRFALTRDTTPLSVDVASTTSARRLCEPVKLFDFDFMHVGPLARRGQNTRVTFVADGNVNSYALYFDLDLDGTVLSTSPDAPATCWFQSLRYFPHALKVRRGATATLRSAHASGSVAVDIAGLAPPPIPGLSAARRPREPRIAG